MPTVAAIVCNFNQKAFVEAAISSVLEQTYPHLECVVVDDCSTDGSEEAIRGMLARHGSDRFRYIQHDSNRGQMAAMLSGLDATTAPFVAWLDADDIWLPNHIERHVAHHLNPHLNAAISSSNMAVIDGDGTIISGAEPSMSGNSPFRRKKRAWFIAPARLIGGGTALDYTATRPADPAFVNRQYENWVWSPTSGMVFRRAAVDLIRPQDASRLRTCADNYLARFSHVVGGTILIGETLGYYRIHGSNGFAKRTVYGDGPIGQQPKRITVEGDYQFARKMLESHSLIVTLMPAKRLRHVVNHVGKSLGALEQILRNGPLLRLLPITLKARLIRRYARERVRAFLAKQ
jgi:glycosyltransferase involved in cell wall biosynthesis